MSHDFFQTPSSTHGYHQWIPMWKVYSLRPIWGGKFLSTSIAWVLCGWWQQNLIIILLNVLPNHSVMICMVVMIVLLHMVKLSHFLQARRPSWGGCGRGRHVCFKIIPSKQLGWLNQWRIISNSNLSVVGNLITTWGSIHSSVNWCSCSWLYSVDF